jgi:hypothetical protein
LLGCGLLTAQRRQRFIRESIAQTLRICCVKEAS